MRLPSFAAEGAMTAFIFGSALDTLAGLSCALVLLTVMFWSSLRPTC